VIAARNRSWASVLLVLGYGLLAAGVFLYGMIGFFFGSVLAVLAGQEEDIVAGTLPTVLIVTILITTLLSAVALGIVSRWRVAYLVHLALLVGAIPLALTPLVFPPAAALALFVAGGPAEPAAQYAAIRDVVLASIALLAGAVVVTALSYGDFFARRERIRTTGLTPSPDPYLAGLRYRALGMWYLAALEWEQALTLSPDDGELLYALGLAYERLGRDAEALRSLRAAYHLKPTPAIANSIQAVERRIIEP
jgi:tetratricopeptide (TPR) repeat protein